MPLGTPVPPPAAAKEAKGETDTMKRPPAEAGGNGMPCTMPPRIQVDHVNGIWRVTKHGRFYGDFLREQDASSAGEAAASVAAAPFVTESAVPSVEGFHRPEEK